MAIGRFFERSGQHLVSIPILADRHGKIVSKRDSFPWRLQGFQAPPQFLEEKKRARRKERKRPKDALS